VWERKLSLKHMTSEKERIKTHESSYRFKMLEKGLPVIHRQKSSRTLIE
jgi:hypothetical protein